MGKHKLGLSIDEDLYHALKKLPRDISISDVFTVLFQTMIEEVKLGKKMSKEEMNEWMESDDYRREARRYGQEKIGPYVDLIDSCIDKVKINFDKKK